MSAFKTEDVDNERDKDMIADEGSGAAAARARLARKRTKTGCLTCRRRRIKCDEGKPICRNCQKSRRQCEGYNQRVVFKPADFQYLGPHGAATITFHTSMLPGVIGPPNEEHVTLGQPELRPRAVAPPGYALDLGTHQYQHVTPHQDGPPNLYTPSLMQSVAEPHVRHQYWGMNFAYQAPQLEESSFPGSGYAPFETNPYVQTSFGVARHRVPIEHAQTSQASHPAFEQLPVRSSSLVLQDEPLLTSQLWNQSAMLPPHLMTLPPNWADQQAQTNLMNADIDPIDPSRWQQGPSRVTISQTTTVQHEWPAMGFVPQPDVTRQMTQQPMVQLPPRFLANQLYEQPPEPGASAPGALGPDALGPGSSPPQSFLPLQYVNHGVAGQKSPSPARLLEEAAVQHYDEDYYDVDQEDELDLEISTKILEQKSQGLLKNVIAMSGLDVSVLAMRGFDTFIYEGILDTYRPEMTANPLRNSATARVFAHFITATGPLLTIFVRQTRASSAFHHDGVLPLSQQGLWTYIMPMAALHHQGLLQAILAIASLHIAKLQQASETPSFKHYGYALKSIHRSVRNPEKRHSTATLAATLLLGYYEIMAANHTNWSTHLGGAKQLITETDFLSMTKEFIRLKKDKALRDQYNPYYMSGMPPLPYSSKPHDFHLDQVPDIDESVVSIFAGRSLNYDALGHVAGERDELNESRDSAPLDIVNYETLKDLFWWYCKQDVYQSIISGNPLLMSFDHWTDCPPRAPLNAADAVYGSFDHLMILLARIADFTTRDRKRKLKAMQANGGAWRPAPGMQLGPRPGAGPPGHAPPTAPSGPAGQSSGPPSGPPPQAGPSPQMPFFGMAPPRTGAANMPSSYQPTNQATPLMQQVPTPGESPPWTTHDLPRATEQALQEWDEIMAAADVFVQRLGSSFQPLGPEYQQPMNSPFGPVIFYRSWDISCLWALYNMCLVILIRAHPHMPPAAHMAAGVAAFQTKDIVMRIGRIAAGVPLPPPEQPLNPNLAASLCDLAVPLFFAGISYQTPDQRTWLVERLFNVDRRAGWATAGIIAEGCQTAWVKAAAAGRGPPHERIQRANFNDSRVYQNKSSFEVVQGSVQVSEDDNDDNGRRFVHEKATARLHWGIGIIGGEDDFKPEPQ